MRSLRNCGWIGLALLLLSGPQLGWAQDAQAPAERPATRWESAIQALEQAQPASAVQPGGVVFVGSSSIRLWKLEDAFPNVRLVNCGFGGSEVKDTLHYFDRLILPYRPGLVVFYAGDNDIANKTPPATVSEQFSALVARLNAALPETKLIYIPIKPSVRRWEQIELQREANRLIKAQCEADDRLTYLPIEADMLGANGEPRPELFVADGLHLSAAGYAQWNNRLRPYLAPYTKYSQSGLKVFAAGTRPDDRRLKPLRTLNDSYHPWVPPQSKEAWEQEAARIRRQLLVSNGLWPMPPRFPLEPVIHGRIDCGEYTIEKVYFATAPGLYLTGNLYRPKQINGKIPGVLCPHGHWANGRFYDAGERGAAQELQSQAEQFEPGARSPLQARMVHLARMGCTVFHYDMMGYADQPGIDHRGEFNDVAAALWLHSKMGLQTWNSIRALDFLESLPEVDPQRIAVTGASGGGTQTFILGAIDPRPAVAFPAVMVGTAMQGGCNCENAHYMRIGINNVAFAAMFAPRPQALSGANDWTIDIETKGLPELKQIYGYYGAADLVHAKCYPQFGHNYNQVSREMMYAWFREHLDLGDVPVQEQPFERKSRAELTVFDANHPRPQDVLDSATLREQWSEFSREQLAEITSEADYQEIVGGAAAVMFGDGLPTAAELHLQEIGQHQLGEYSVMKFVVGRKSEESRIPVVVLLREGQFNGEVELRLFGNGKQGLLDAQGNLTAEVRETLDRGVAILSADLYRTGEYLQGENLPKYEVNASDPVYTFCYNRPLIAERVRDIVCLVAAARQHPDVKEVHLRGEGDAGLWVLLARSILPAGSVGETSADLQGFSFAKVKDPQDPQLLPGALRYGDVPGFVRLAAAPGVKISIRGIYPAAWWSTERIFRSRGGVLTLQQ